MSVISNTTVISNFAGIGQMDILRWVHDKIHLPIQVYEEIQAGLEEGYLFYADIKQSIHPFSKTGWMKLTSFSDDNEYAFLERIPKKLGKGEASCLSIAAHRNWLFLTDDLDARKQANSINVRISGSLGCLILAIEKDICSLDQANRWLWLMIEQGYHSPVHDLNDLI